MARLDAHQRPPEHLRVIFKTLRKENCSVLTDSGELFDFSRCPEEALEGAFKAVGVVNQSLLRFIEPLIYDAAQNISSLGSCSIFESSRIPGFQIIPSLVPTDVQLNLVSRILHRDLANPAHNTNIHKHYHVPYELTRRPLEQDGFASFFRIPPSSPQVLQPLDPSDHKPLTIRQFLDRKLRWITLGGQYDWTGKVYPPEEPPAFPPDIATIAKAACPSMVPEAAIFNIYTPGDTLSLHRDVSEESDAPLVSISVGCDGVFVLGLDDDPGVDSRRGTGENSQSSSSGKSPPPHVAVRLCSGDAVVMSGAARFAWHGVPQVIPNTCPAELQYWPAPPTSAKVSESSTIERTDFEHWRGWMATKRINLNVRQMTQVHSVIDL